MPPAKHDVHKQALVSGGGFLFLPGRYGTLVYLLYGFNLGQISGKTSLILCETLRENGWVCAGLPVE